MMDMERFSSKPTVIDTWIIYLLSSRM